MYAVNQGLITAEQGQDFYSLTKAELQQINDQINIQINSTLSGLQKSVTYIASVVGSYLCAQNGTTGQLAYKSTNKSATLNYMSDSLTDGGIIFVRKAEMNLTKPWRINNNGITVYGESIDGVVSSTVLYSQTGNIMELGNDAIPGGGLRNIHISNIQFGRYLVTSGGHAIVSTYAATKNVYMCEIDHNTFTDLGQYSAISITGFERLNIHDNQMYQTTGKLIDLRTTSYESGQLTIERNEMSAGHNNTVAIYLEYGLAGGSMGFIRDNFISGGADTGNVEYGIVLNASSNNDEISIANMHIEKNYFDDAPLLIARNGSSYVRDIFIIENKWMRAYTSVPYDIEMRGRF